MARNKLAESFTIWGDFVIPPKSELRSDGDHTKMQFDKSYSIWKPYMFDTLPIRETDESIDVMFFESDTAKTDHEHIIHILSTGFRPVTYSELRRVQWLLNSRKGLRRGFLEQICWHLKKHSRSVIVLDALGSNMVNHDGIHVAHPQLTIPMDLHSPGHFSLKTQAYNGITLVTPFSENTVEAVA